MPLTLAAFQQLIRERYSPTDSARGTPGTFMWFIEEVGELATALHNNAPGKAPSADDRANLDEEFADVLAWLTTLANINGVDLERALARSTSIGRVISITSVSSSVGPCRCCSTAFRIVAGHPPSRSGRDSATI